jgi:hypothetical protein
MPIGRADDSPPIMVGQLNLPLAGDESNRKEQSKLAIDSFIRVFVAKHILILIVIMDLVTYVDNVVSTHGHLRSIQTMRGEICDSSRRWKDTRGIALIAHDSLTSVSTGGNGGIDSAMPAVMALRKNV